MEMILNPDRPGGSLWFLRIEGIVCVSVIRPPFEFSFFCASPRHTHSVRFINSHGARTSMEFTGIAVRVTILASTGKVFLFSNDKSVNN